jgi:hypothetical protein
VDSTGNGKERKNQKKGKIKLERCTLLSAEICQGYSLHHTPF